VKLSLRKTSSTEYVHPLLPKKRKQVKAGKDLSEKSVILVKFIMVKQLMKQIKWD